MLSAMLRRFHRTSFIFLAVAALASTGCERRAGCTGPNCGTLINVAVAEPPTLLPPSTEDIVASVTQRDWLTTVLRLKEKCPELLYDAVYHMRILPAHLLRGVPRDQWKTAPFGRPPVGDGAYRFVRWQAAQSIELVADSTFFLGRPGIRRLIWRITPHLPVAVQQVIAGEADVREQVVTPENLERLRAAPQIALYPYRGNVY